MKNVMSKCFPNGLSKCDLKATALLAMMLDHIAYTLNMRMDIGVLFYFFRIIGRIAFPIYAFCLVDGLIWTKDRRKYIIRLLILALVSEIPYDIFMYGKIISFAGANVIFTLLLGYLCIFFIQHSKTQSYLQYILLTSGFMAVAELLGVDYGACGILLIVAFYLFPILDEMNGWIYYLVVAAFVLELGSFSLFMLLGFVFIKKYNGVYDCDGFLRVYNYCIYPVHLLLLGLVGWGMLV